MSQTPIQKLKALIAGEERRTGQLAGRVRISREYAEELRKVTAGEWLEASNGMMTLDECKKRTWEFFTQGIEAFNGVNPWGHVVLTVAPEPGWREIEMVDLYGDQVPDSLK